MVIERCDYKKLERSKKHTRNVLRKLVLRPKVGGNKAHNSISANLRPNINVSAKRAKTLCVRYDDGRFRPPKN